MELGKTYSPFWFQHTRISHCNGVIFPYSPWVPWLTWVPSWGTKGRKVVFLGGRVSARYEGNSSEKVRIIRKKATELDIVSRDPAPAVQDHFQGWSILSSWKDRAQRCPLKYTDETLNTNSTLARTQSHSPHLHPG